MLKINPNGNSRKSLPDEVCGGGRGGRSLQGGRLHIPNSALFHVMVFSKCSSGRHPAKQERSCLNCMLCRACQSVGSLQARGRRALVSTPGHCRSVGHRCDALVMELA